MEFLTHEKHKIQKQPLRGVLQKQLLDKKFLEETTKIVAQDLFFFYIYNLHFFKQNVYSHQVLIYLHVPGIPVRKPLQNRKIVEEQLDV